MTEGKNEAEDAKQIEEKIKQEAIEAADGARSPEMIFDMAAFVARQKGELDEARAAQKDDFIASCTALAEFGVAKVKIEYEGSGDSGCVESVAFVDADDEPVELTEEQDMSVPCKVEAARTWSPGDEPNTGTWSVSYKDEGLKAFFEECAYKWLPGGWEINSGSFGTIRVDVAGRSYSVDHGWRVEDVESVEFSFDFSSEEASS